MQKLIIDRFEGSYAVCEKEDKSTVLLPKYKLPFGCKEGECLIMDSIGMYQKDTLSYTNRDKRIHKKLSRLFKY